ncbi:MAG: right-handed parallel beta-helix repeat-containing protein [Candidatus Altiarchaeota archaeon]
MQSIAVFSRQDWINNTNLNSGLTCNGSALLIGDVNITLDCMGQSISGNMSGYGINISDLGYVTVKNCVVGDFEAGIFLSNSSANILWNNTLANNTKGISLSVACGQNNISNNTLLDNDEVGVYIFGSSSENKIYDNHIRNSGWFGINIYYYSLNNSVIGNSVVYNGRHGMYLQGDTSQNNTLLSNEFCYDNQSGGEYFDLYNDGLNMGDNNTCDTNYNWNDSGTTGCSQSCPTTTTTSTLPDIVINEFMPNATQGNDWVEVYNVQDTPVELSDEVMSFIHGSDHGVWWRRDVGFLNTSLSSRGFLMFYENQSLLGNLNESVGWISLLFNGSLIQNISYNATEFNQSWNAIPQNISLALPVDGGGETYYVNCNPTPNGINLCPQDFCVGLFSGWTLISLSLTP